MIRPILKYGESLLHRQAEPVHAITAEIADLARDMVETMHAAPGIGLAAPQVGVPIRLIVIDLSVGRSRSELITLVNPEFVERGGMQIEEEGCLSVPGINATVARPERATIKGIDLEGRDRDFSGQGLLARAFQHELDHLDGRVFIDRLRGIERNMIVRRIRRQIRRGRW